MNWAGTTIFMSPPYAHVNIVSLLSIGPILDMTLGFMGSQVPIGVGIQGPGVNIPKAAAVSAAVIGFIKLVQTPKGIILRNGTQSAMLPIGPAGPIIIDVGRKVSGAGAIPNGH